MAVTMTRRVVRFGGWRLAKALIKPVPVVGTALALGLAGYEMKKKGALRGAVHVGLDILPVIGAAKGIIELFDGDLIPDEEEPQEQTAERPEQKREAAKAEAGKGTKARARKAAKTQRRQPAKKRGTSK